MGSGFAGLLDSACGNRGAGCARSGQRGVVAVRGCYTGALIHRLVLENLKHRPVRTLLSAVAIGVQVTMILTLVGVSEGVLGDIARNSRGTGADILVRPPGQFGAGVFGRYAAGHCGLVRTEPHVVQATGTKVNPSAISIPSRASIWTSSIA